MAALDVDANHFVGLQPLAVFMHVVRPVWQAERRVEPRDQMDIFAEKAPEHLFGLLHDRVEVERPGPDHLLAAECQQLLREFGCAYSCFADLLDL